MPSQRPALLALLPTLLLLLQALALGVPGQAGAQTPGPALRSDPAANATVAAPPARIDLFFVNPVDPAAPAAIRLLDQTGAGVPLDPTVVDPGEPRYVFATIPTTLPAGTYTVLWSARPAADAAPRAGSYAFRVAPPTAAGAATGADTWPAPWGVATRWLTWLGLALALGALLLGRLGAVDGARRLELVATGGVVALLATAAQPPLARLFPPAGAPAPALAEAFARMPLGWWVQVAGVGLLALLGLAFVASGRAANATTLPPAVEWGGLALGLVGVTGLVATGTGVVGMAALAASVVGGWTTVLWIGGAATLALIWRRARAAPDGAASVRAAAPAASATPATPASPLSPAGSGFDKGPPASAGVAGHAPTPPPVAAGGGLIAASAPRPEPAPSGGRAASNALGRADGGAAESVEADAAEAGALGGAEPGPPLPSAPGWQADVARRFAPIGLGLALVGVSAAVVAALVAPSQASPWGSAWGWVLIAEVGALLLAVALTLAGLGFGALRRGAAAAEPNQAAAAAPSSRTSPLAAPKPAPSQPSTPGLVARPVAAASALPVAGARAGVGLRVGAVLAALGLLAGSVLALMAPPGAGAGTLARVTLVAPLPVPVAGLGEAPGLVQVGLAPARPGSNLVTVRLAEATGGVPIDGDLPTVQVALAPLDHAAPPAILEPRVAPETGIAAGRVDLPGTGWWQLDVTATGADGQGAPATFYVVLPDPNATGAGASAAPPSDPAAEAVFARGLAGMSGLRSVRAGQRFGDGTGTLYLSRTEMTVDPPAYAERSSDGEAIVAGDRQWLRRAGGAWEERPAGAALLVLPSRWGETYAPATGFRLGPVREIAGARCRVVTFFVPGQATGPRDDPAWYAWWVDEETGQVRREVMISSYHYMVADFFDFDAPIAIEPPDLGADAGASATPTATPAGGT